MTGFYDAQLQQLFLKPYAINAGNVAAVFNGGILSTTSSGKISMQSNPNAISIVNQTNIPMVLQGIAASVTGGGVDRPDRTVWSGCFLQGAFEHRIERGWGTIQSWIGRTRCYDHGIARNRREFKTA